MTRQDLLNVVRACYSAFAARDLARLRALSAVDCVYEAPGVPAYMPWARRHEGHAGLAHFIAALDEHLVFLLFQPTEFFVDEAQQAVVVLGRAECRSRATNRTYVNQWAHLFKMHADLIVLFREYPDTAAQLLAVHPIGADAGGSTSSPTCPAT